MISKIIIRFSYVNSAPIKQIKQKMPAMTLWQKVKAQLKIGSIIMSSGYKDFKQDLSFYVKNVSKQNKTPQQSRLLYRVRSDLWKVPPIGILFFLPFGIPFVLLYMALFRPLTPTWFLLDTNYEELLKQHKKKREQALKFFMKNGSVKFNYSTNKFQTTINLPVFEKMSLPEKKRVHQLCFGYSFDGTNLIRKCFSLNFDYLFSYQFTQYILCKNLLAKLKFENFSSNDLDDNNELSCKIIKQIEFLSKQGVVIN